MREPHQPAYARYALIALVALGLLLLGSCTSVAGAARAGMLPALDWQIPLGQHRALLVHNGPTLACQRWALRDSCRARVVRHEFYMHYIAPTTDRVLIWFETRPNAQP